LDENGKFVDSKRDYDWAEIAEKIINQQAEELRTIGGNLGK
jgi:hypothetical protein